MGKQAGRHKRGWACGAAGRQERSRLAEIERKKKLLVLCKNKKNLAKVKALE